MVHDTIPRRLAERAQHAPDQPAYFCKEKEMWRGTSWSSYAAEVQRAAKSLLALGLAPGESVAILAGNRPEWSTLMLAAMTVGARGSGLYTTSSLAETQAILAQTAPRVVLVDSQALFTRVRELSPGLPALQRVITSRAMPPVADPLALTWSAFLRLGDGIPDAAVRDRLATVTPDTVATVVYTSGAELPPRGVLLSHRNLTWTCDAANHVLRIGERDTSLSFLPLAHVSEQLFTVHGPVSTGSRVYYAESAQRAPANLREIQPSVLFGVPRIWEKLQTGTEARIEQLSGRRARLVAWSRQVATRMVEARSRGNEPSMELAAQYELAQSLALSKLKQALGLGAARVCVSGAAPIAVDTLRFFASLGIQLLEAYGHAEATGPITLNQPQRARFGTAGPKLPGLKLWLADDGEVLVSGPSVFVGYCGDEQTRPASSEPGVLHTGDVGELDAQGFLTITGAKRQPLVTAAGKHVSPRTLEAALESEELIRDAILIGDERRFLSALITVDEEVAKRLGLRAPLHENEVVRERVARRVEALNARLGSVEQVRRHLILPHALRIETGELTPTLKLRRQRIEELWSREIEAIYDEPPDA